MGPTHKIKDKFHDVLTAYEPFLLSNRSSSTLMISAAPKLAAHRIDQVVYNRSRTLIHAKTYSLCIPQFHDADENLFWNKKPLAYFEVPITRTNFPEVAEIYCGTYFVWYRPDLVLEEEDGGFLLLRLSADGERCTRPEGVRLWEDVPEGMEGHGPFQGRVVGAIMERVRKDVEAFKAGTLVTYSGAGEKASG